MDATSLRWILVIIGVVVILGVYLFSIYQSKLRRNAAIKTFTQDEMESGVIEDDALRDELSHINTMLDQEIAEDDIEDILIKTTDDAQIAVEEEPPRPPLMLPSGLLDIARNNRVVHVLKPDDDHLLTSDELISAMQHVQFILQEDGMMKAEFEDSADFLLASLTDDGSLAKINDAQYSTPGLVCYFDMASCKQPMACYEFMLKKIDELVRELNLKVYDEDLQLLTLQHVTDTRRQINSLE
jgi:FtsZ-interacting cell division protein ZipA